MTIRRLAWPALLGLIAFARTASAYRTASELQEFSGSQPVRWATPEISYVRDPNPPSELTSAEVQAAFAKAFQAWSEPPCSAVTFVDQGTSSEDAAPDDGTNTIQWLSTEWDATGAPADAAALTDVQYERAPGGEWQIVEADLYLNAENHSFALTAADETTRDLQSVVTHEAGHILGLLHPCEFGGEDGAPDCDAMPAALQTTMYPAYSAGQRTLAGDDQAGVCNLYPTADDANPETPGELGATCSEANDCLDGQCLAGLSEAPICTKVCHASSDCPADWQCSAVDDRDVCSPPVALNATGGAGCRMSPAAPDAPGVALFLSIIAGLAALRRRPVGALE
jgi:Matrixin